MITQSTYATVAVITHGGPIQCIVRDILKLGELKRIANGAIIELEKNDTGLHVVHIDGAIRSET